MGSGGKESVGKVLMSKYNIPAMDCYFLVDFSFHERKMLKYLANPLLVVIF